MYSIPRQVATVPLTLPAECGTIQDMRCMIPTGATWLRFPRFVGDAAMQLPILRLLRNQGVGPLVWGPAATVALVADNELADAVVPDQGRPGPWAMAALLRRHRAARSIHFPKSLRPALAAFLARVPERIGVDESLAGVFNTHSGPFWDAQGPFMARYHAVLAKRWPGLPPMPYADYAPLADVRLPEEPYLCLMPGSTWPSKAWPREHFLALARKARLDGMGVAVLGSPGEQDICAFVAQGATHDLCGRTTLVEAAAWLRGARAALGNDSGLSHLAAACGTPTLALYGATDPGGSTPWGPSTLALRLDGIPCAPCFKPDCFVAGHPCLAGLDPGRVWASLLALFRA
jgi:heptosyltransferase-2